MQLHDFTFDVLSKLKHCWGLRPSYFILHLIYNVL